jgi:hypothetical protein
MTAAMVAPTTNLDGKDHSKEPHFHSKVMRMTRIIQHQAAQENGGKLPSYFGKVPIKDMPGLMTSLEQDAREYEERRH